MQSQVHSDCMIVDFLTNVADLGSHIVISIRAYIVISVGASKDINEATRAHGKRLQKDISIYPPRHPTLACSFSAKSRKRVAQAAFFSGFISSLFN